MSEVITVDNLDKVIELNKDIVEEISRQVLTMKGMPMVMESPAGPHSALTFLQRYGLIQIPIDDKFFSGAIYIKEGKYIPVINTALPRANQYYTAWHELYHLIFDNVSFDVCIGTDNTIEERKAESFAAKMLLTGVERYFLELTESEFLTKVFYCMSAFQSPYKAVLFSLYEYAVKSDNSGLKKKIKEYFDLRFDDMTDRFRELGLDESLVAPSFTVNIAYLKGKIKANAEKYPDLKYHKENEEFLSNIVKEVHMTVRKDK